MFFGSLVETSRLAQLIDFENRERLFPAVDSRMKFSILSIGPANRASFAFFLTNTAQLAHEERRFTLTPNEIARVNPNTMTAPVFRSRADAKLTASLYARSPILIEDVSREIGREKNPWGFTYQTKMFDMADSSHLFLKTPNSGLEGGADVSSGLSPLYEAKMIHQFDHRWASFD
ncbi:hypothetical protein RCCGE510_33389, partial [Rhizobium sp. CCGE 510]